jgi:hypothetical protein
MSTFLRGHAFGSCNCNRGLRCQWAANGQLRKEYYTPTQPPNNAPVDYCDTAQKNGRRVGPWLDS